jgi:hypothetical protein
MRGPYIEDFAAIATMSLVLHGVTDGECALVEAHSKVSRDQIKHAPSWPQISWEIQMILNEFIKLSGNAISS